MKRWLFSTGSFCLFAAVLGEPTFVQAQTTFTVVPPSGGTVAASGPIVFTFSEPMETDPSLTTVDFLDISSPLTPLAVTLSWDGSAKVLTCTPNPPFPVGKMIVWSLQPTTVSGNSVDTETGGYFTTTTGGGGGTGSGTNKFTSFSVLKVHSYSQTNAAGPYLDLTYPYGLIASTILASNRTASGISLKLPTGVTNSLTTFLGHPENYNFFGGASDLTSFNTTYPAGTYTFFVLASASNETVTVTLPPDSAQPNAPTILNFSSLTNVDASKPLTIDWGAFQGGTSADYIAVDIGNVTNTPGLGLPGALTGAATSFALPAGILQANSNYDATLGFYHGTFTTNASEWRGAFRATQTTFTLTTSSGVTPPSPLSLTNTVWSGNALSFEITCSPGQTFTVESSSDISATSWQKVLTTNAPGSRVSVSIPLSTAIPYQFFRARNGS